MRQGNHFANVAERHISHDNAGSIAMCGGMRNPYDLIADSPEHQFFGWKPPMNR